MYFPVATAIEVLNCWLIGMCLVEFFHSQFSYSHRSCGTLAKYLRLGIISVNKCELAAL